MRIRLVAILSIIFFALGALAHAEALTSDDLIEKIKSIVDIDFEQEDQIKPLLGDYVDAINKVNDLIQKGVDQEVIREKLMKANNALETKLRNVLTPDQMHEWNVEKRVMYKEILATANSQNQS